MSSVISRDGRTIMRAALSHNSAISLLDISNTEHRRADKSGAIPIYRELAPFYPKMGRACAINESCDKPQPAVHAGRGDAAEISAAGGGKYATSAFALPFTNTNFICCLFIGLRLVFRHSRGRLGRPRSTACPARHFPARLEIFRSSNRA